MGVLRVNVGGSWVDVTGGGDEVWVGPDQPTDAACQLWIDTDATSTTGTGSAEEVFVGPDEPSGDIELWLDTDAPTPSMPLPSGMPRGLVAAPVTSPGINGVAATMTDIPNLSIAWTAEATRYYLTTLTVQLIQNTSAGYVSLVITDINNNILKTAVWYATVPGESRITLPLWEYGISGAQTRKGRINTSVGTVNVFAGSGNREAQMLVQDIGGM